MSQENIENRYMQETGLFPPGRDIPASRGELDIDEYRAAAFRYWRLADSYTWWTTAADLVNTYLRELGADDDQIKHPQELPAAIERLVHLLSRGREHSGTGEWPAVKTVTLDLCELCLSGAGGICHVPGCALCRSRAPDIDIRESVRVNEPSDPAAPTLDDQIGGP